MIVRVLRRTLLGLALMAPLALQAESPAAPSGEVILTITGLPETVAPGGTVAYDLAGLESLGPVSFTTTSIWTEGPHEFTGIPLRRLASKLGLTGTETVVLHALNDYQVEFPLTEAEDEAPILAYEMDGKPMSVRDKGPVWLVYPYDADAEAYQSVTAFARSVWQMDRIDVQK